MKPLARRRYYDLDALKLCVQDINKESELGHSREITHVDASLGHARVRPRYISPSETAKVRRLYIDVATKPTIQDAIRHPQVFLILSTQRHDFDQHLKNLGTRPQLCAQTPLYP